MSPAQTPNADPIRQRAQTDARLPRRAGAGGGNARVAWAPPARAGPRSVDATRFRTAGGCGRRRGALARTGSRRGAAQVAWQIRIVGTQDKGFPPPRLI